MEAPLVSKKRNVWGILFFAITLDPQFVKIDDHTYQSPDYNDAVDKIDITVESGAGDVNVITK